MPQLAAFSDLATTMILPQMPPPLWRRHNAPKSGVCAHTELAIASASVSSSGSRRQPAFVTEGFSQIVTTLSTEERALWCELNPASRPSFTGPLLADLGRMQRAIVKAFENPGFRPFEYLIVSSLSPGFFSLGGDLSLFQEKIEAGDETALRQYAHRCVETVFINHRGYENRVTTIALIQGDALGGGFETALSCDLIVAERQAKMGFPEILFNLFPGMGAYTFLSRRIGVANTEEMLRSGAMYSASELNELGVVDLVVEQGQGANAVRDLIRKQGPRHNAHCALHQVRRRVNPITLEELKNIADIWVDAALRLGEQDLRRMSRIRAAQDRARQRNAAQTGFAG